MNIKRFLAPDMRRAIQQVRSEHGPDAVILSSRSLDGGVEIVAAVDYDETLLEGLSAAAREASLLPEDAPREALDDVGDDVPEHALDDVRDHVRNDVRNDVPKDVPEAAPAAMRDDAWRTDAAPAHGEGHGEAPGDTPARGARVDDSAPREGAWPREAAAAAPVPAAENLAEMHSELKVLKGMLREQCLRLKWADMRAFDPERALLKRHIETLELAPSLVETLLAEVVHVDRFDRAWREVMFGLGRRLRVLREDPLDEGGVFALIGPTGVGKTTTIAKLAARHCLRYGRDSLALITIDNFRVGAQRQLDAFGAILGVPVRRADSADALEAALGAAADRRLVLIDTAGMAPRDARLKGSLEQLEYAGELKRFLVLAANMQRAVMTEAVRTFGARGLAGIVLTKLDEAEGLGAALSALIEAQLPAAWISEGQRVPEDLKLARVSHLLKWAAGAQIDPDGVEQRPAHAFEPGVPHAFEREPVPAVEPAAARAAEQRRVHAFV
jgi:flagellar biosynthesis protein FlhF